MYQSAATSKEHQRPAIVDICHVVYSYYPHSPLDVIIIHMMIVNSL